MNLGGGSLAPFWIPAGSGGGCVQSGPFVDYTVNLGPVSVPLPGGVSGTNPNNDTGIFSWNPRCLKRDLTDYSNQNFANASSVLSVVQDFNDIATFQDRFQGSPDPLGLHGGGMYLWRRVFWRFPAD